MPHSWPRSTRAWTRSPRRAQFASGPRLSPRNNESAGKRRTGKTWPCNRWLRQVVVQAARAASHGKGTYLAARYPRVCRRDDASRNERCWRWRTRFW
ncbi:transposase [Singulisphaera sp. Ch08]|uniref:transposase n=1 Tax=Singulisphaera sp. Ch08 TaxID=3120278 RepID=UPI003872B70E